MPSTRSRTAGRHTVSLDSSNATRTRYVSQLGLRMISNGIHIAGRREARRAIRKAKGKGSPTEQSYFGGTRKVAIQGL